LDGESRPMCGGEKSSEQQSLQALISVFPEGEALFFIARFPGVSTNQLKHPHEHSEYNLPERSEQNPTAQGNTR
jgi:hypothetical protein